ncbi:UBAP1-MVB12-associated (UMA)-domain containing protein 1 [Hyla sarda]|uniref:UBAP1-MVB12-associated (UMA)-domain containing protein 1 n=1 Tax=Hyla sarda TaxID=327740 RepID=UPI0024C39280|nr:UBAP1-MVB12-associated (UMA)-domain containing protein 1 [Hyla sarda]XP_056374906.1 UBAP1-MVB12-associated (UMA)-domain containing protein 1 [Hyla sarda]
MFNFLRKSQDTKKNPAADKENDGFVFLGQTPAERRDSTPPFPGSDFSYNLPYQMPPPGSFSQGNSNVSGAAKLTSQVSEGNSVMTDLLNDIPFILAPHVQEVQNICQELPEPVPVYSLDETFARFHYDFTLENSVLCGL